MLRFNSVAFRLLAAAVVVGLAGLIVGGWLLSNVFRQSIEHQLDDRLLGDMENLIAVAEPSPDGHLSGLAVFSDQRYDTAFSGWYWQVMPEEDASQKLVSRSLWDKSLNVPEPQGAALGSGYTTGPENQQLRYIIRRISFPDMSAVAQGQQARTRAYFFAVAADLANSQAEARRFDVTLLWSLGALAASFILATLIQVRVGLSPLRVVRDRLAAIRGGRATRLEGSFPAEIAPLAEEMNALIAHNADVVQRARTHVGNLAHGLKTPLSVLTSEAAQTRSAFSDTVMKQTAVMRRQVDHYLARARAAASAEVIGARTDTASAIADLARTLEKIYGGKGVEVETAVPAGINFRGERQDFEELAGNLLDNACKWAASTVLVSATDHGPKFDLVVEDDGPGLTAEQLVRVLEKRERIDESVPGSGLGLGIVRDIADLYGGRLELSRAPKLGGLRATLTLPTA